MEIKLRAPTKNEWIAGGIGALVGPLAYPYAKKAVVYTGGKVANAWQYVTRKKDKDKDGKAETKVA